MQDKCGVVGIWEVRNPVAPLVVQALAALQHRGLESAGLCTSDGARLHRQAGGRVDEVFAHEPCVPPGTRGIGHTRYSTVGASCNENTQPIVVESAFGKLALGHNGSLVNIERLRQEVARLGAVLRSSSDSELIAHLIARASGADWLDRIRNALAQLQGAFCLVLLTRDQLFVARDPWGIHPLALGRVSSGWIAASETCALDRVGASFEREVAPGELITIDAKGLRSERLRNVQRRAACSFEYIYFSQPDSMLDGRLVSLAREAMGEELAHECPARADVVVAVPMSAVPGAVGYARAAGIAYRDGLIADARVGRTFLRPLQYGRQTGVELKYTVVPQVVDGREVVLVDDSLVRGTTTRYIVDALRRAGAIAVHLRICAPPIKNACYLGVDMAPEETLIASSRTVDQVRAEVGADSLGYLSRQGLSRALSLDESVLCNACFHGRYPMPIESGLNKLVLERGP